MRNPLNDRVWLRASTRGCDAYTNRHIHRQISFNHAGFSVLVGSNDILGF
jgi:hypothetical protein